MRFYSVAELKSQASKILSEGQRHHRDALITRHGKPLALLVPISEEELEWSSSPAVRERLRQAVKERKSGKTVTLRKLASRD